MWLFRSNYLQTFYVTAVLGLGIYSWFSLELLPDPASDNAGAEVFSAARAIAHVKNLAKHPRVLGTPANEVARSYLSQQMSLLGCPPQIQKKDAVTQKGEYVFSAQVQNIYCVLPGRKKDAILLMSHYDSVDNSPGAADSAVGASIVLETARALKGQSRENTLVLLLTDGEENALKGASAFVRENLHESLQVQIALNFEGRGNSGPLALFETHRFNSVASHALRKVPRPVGNSFMDLLYQFLPNETDVSILKSAGIPALNFAFARGLQHYHHSSDTPENFSLASLQHGGDSALALTTELAGMNLANFKAHQGERLYLDILSRQHLSFPPSLVKGLGILLMIAIIFCFWAWGRGAVRYLAATALCAGFFALSLFLMSVTRAIVAEWIGFDQSVIHFYSLFWLLVLLVLAPVHWLFIKLKRRFPDLSFGILGVLLLLLTLLPYFPAAGNLLLWPSLAVVIFCVRPSLLWRNVAASPIALLLPALLHSALIADSGTQLVLPAFIFIFGVALLHLLFLNPYVTAGGGHASAEVQRAGAYGFLHCLALAAGAGMLGYLALQSVPQSRAREKRGDFFEIASEGKVYVALRKGMDFKNIFSSMVSNSERELLLNPLQIFYIRPQDFHVFPTGAEAPRSPLADFTLWERDDAQQYLVDIPAQDYECVALFLHHFDNIRDFKVNSLEPFQIPPKRFQSLTPPLVLVRCGLRDQPLRVEFQRPAGSSASARVFAVFSKTTEPPPELALSPDMIWARSSKMMYVLKNIAL